MASLLRKYRKHHGLTGANRPKPPAFNPVPDTTSEKEEKIMVEDIKTEEPATSGYVEAVQHEESMGAFKQLEENQVQ